MYNIESRTNVRSNYRSYWILMQLLMLSEHEPGGGLQTKIRGTPLIDNEIPKAERLLT